MTSPESKMAERGANALVRSDPESDPESDPGFVNSPNLPSFLISYANDDVVMLLVGIHVRKVVRFLSKQGQAQPHFHSKARQLSTKL